MPSSHAHLYLKREQLYELVWAKPMQHLAKEYGISDRALAKLCTRHQVPVPPRGYWARISAGQKVQKAALPAFVPKKPAADKTASHEAEKELKKPVEKKASVSSYFEDRDKKIKLAIRELRKRFTEPSHYKIAVQNWSCDYRFGINPRFDPLYKKEDFGSMHAEPYNEWRHLEFKGAFLSPPALKDKKVRLNLFERDYLNASEREKNLRIYQETPPSSVGNLQKGSEEYWAYISCPENAVQSLLQVATANKINFVSLCTEKMRYGQASILSYSLDDKNAEDEEEKS